MLHYITWNRMALKHLRSHRPLVLGDRRSLPTGGSPPACAVQPRHRSALLPDWITIDNSKLNEFSQGFYFELSRTFPELASKAVVETDPTVTPGSLVIQFSAPRPESVFWVTTDNEEVTVGFDQYHSHFNWPVVVVEIWEKAGKWAGSSVLDAGQKPDLSGVEDDHVVFVRSWSGLLDRAYTREDQAR